ncbi:MAG: hypothetical protein A2381_10410 [Bdellovibrionales bacterium RIFOXYB1_FULL_37_110]|nr:MAG: hypothetical protein A2417_05710 [Bdellovibrionales bacterium RIFOXYC1_FULL_37_79]OFZ61175.1 MAG: hypothetical protein A2381_10410 [Bdellovibrionales bacterium RIFOXYB1_FULL_37_110]OFZ65503.1 MAG: hypothetical protein A2577_01830 [Bdellovibrionales bacterium RIFOXYD1_FULL_36_51]
MKNILLVIFLIASANIYAINFSGNWQGIGDLDLNTDVVQGKFSCKNVTLSINHTGSALDISQCKFDECINNQENNFFIKCAELQLDIRDKKLFFQDKQVGFINDNVALINTMKDGWTISTTLKYLTDGSMEYSYASMKPQPVNSVRTKAKLYQY